MKDKNASIKQHSEYLKCFFKHLKRSTKNVTGTKCRHMYLTVLSTIDAQLVMNRLKMDISGKKESGMSVYEGAAPERVLAMKFLVWSRLMKKELDLDVSDCDLSGLDWNGGETQESRDEPAPRFFKDFMRKYQADWNAEHEEKKEDVFQGVCFVLCLVRRLFFFVMADVIMDLDLPPCVDMTGVSDEEEGMSDFECQRRMDAFFEEDRRYHEY